MDKDISPFGYATQVYKVLQAALQEKWKDVRDSSLFKQVKFI
jgi:hypothetical protein